LLLLARCHVPVQVRAQFDPADVVQETLLRAHRSREQCRAKTEIEFRGWLRTILKNALAEFLRRVLPQVAVDRAVEESSLRLEMFLADDQSTPSQRMMREEQLIRLADALGRLPEDQRQAVQFYHLDGHSRAEVARQMGRSEDAVNGLLIRGLRKLRGLLQEQ